MPSRLTLPGLLLGFALGGFFDGILLHQILQWHHLLSLVDGVDTLAAQVVADGLFHLLMYLVALVGLALLLRRRDALAAAGAGRALLAAALLGFGGWHMTDGVLSHWLLGIHRIRLNSPHPLAWDLGWFILFGLAPALAGWWLGQGRGEGRGGGRGAPLAGGLVAVALLSGLWAARPPANADATIAVFRPRMSDGEVMNAVLGSGAVLLWRSGDVWALRWTGEPRPGRLYRHGALMVAAGAFGPACLSWSRRA